MDVTVELREPDAEARRLNLRAGSTEVGRETSGLIVKDPGVSRRHLVLKVGEGVLTVHDLGSTNGTNLNGALLTAPTLLKRGDVLRFGSTEIEIVDTGEAPITLPPPAAAPTPAITPTPAPQPAFSSAPPLPPPEANLQRPADSTEPREVATPAVRPALDDLEAKESASAVIRYRRGSAAESAVDGFAGAVRRARRKLAGLGSEPWGIKPQICLVDPFPDPQDPSQVITTGSVVDPDRGEIWMVVNAESPPEAPERPLALLFGSALPAGSDLAFLLEGYGLHLAGTPDPNPQLASQDLPPIAAADGDLAGPMALSFVRYLVERGGPESFRRLLVESQPGRVETTAMEVYGSGISGLEQDWRMKLAQGTSKVRTGEFLRLTLRYIRPHIRREAEMFVYMLASLAFTLVFPFAVRRLLDTAIPSGEFSQVLGVLTLLGVAFVVSLLAGLRRSYLSAYVSSGVVRQIRVSMFARLQQLSTGWFARHQQGDVLSRLISDVATLEAGISETLREGIFQVLTLIVSTVVLFTLNPLLALIVLAGAPLVSVVYRSMASGARKRSLAVQEQMGGLLAATSENYSGQRVIKAFALESREKGRFGRACDRLFSAQLRMQLFGGIFGLSVNMIFTLLRLIVLGLGAWLILEGNLTIGGLVAFVSLMGEALSPVTALTGLGQQIQAATGALERVNEVLAAVPEVDDSPEATPLPPLKSEIRLYKVSFSYTPERRTLDEIDVTIPAGSRVAFVGPTGAGKSSVLQLLMRFADPEEGAILFDGRDLRSATLDSVRGQLGVVFQDSFLFDTTIRENIAMGKPGATPAEVEVAARAAELHEFISELPRGYDTLVGEGGGRLSGGQRQRLAIARALLRDPSVLILDEATSALDPRTERLISSTLEKVGRGRTTVAVTHRLTSITDYDRIFVIVAGKLVEQGSHGHLVSLNGVYASLWSEQIGGVALVEAHFDAAAALARLPLFGHLEPADMAILVSRLRPFNMASGDRLAEGGGRVALVRRGRANVLAPGLGDGQLEAVSELGPGDAFGVSSFLGQEARLVLSADGPVDLLVLDEEALAGVSKRSPARPSVAPAGGRRLSRISLGIGKPSLGPPASLSLNDDEVRRATGTFGAISR